MSTAAADGQDVRQEGGTALARCAALPSDVFAQEHWGRRPLLSRAAELGSDFVDLLSPAAVDELVSERGLRTPFLRMAKEGVVRPASAYTRGGGAGAAIADQAADDKVLAEIADGSTLVLQGLHRAWPPLVELGTRLAAELGHPVQINAYITPPQNQGFAPHYDVHDVFVLQVAGRKHWVVHEPVVQDPLADQPFDRHRAAIDARVQEPASIDTVLEPGDALYLPRGAVHSAQALGELSIHLTIGLHPLTRHGLVRLLLEAVQDDPRLRASLPMGVDLADPQVLAPLLDDTMSVLSEALSDVAATRIAERVAADLAQRTRPAPLAPLAQLAAIEALTLETPVRLREAVRARVAAEPGAADVNLVLLDRTVALPAQASDALALVLEGGAVTAADLPGLPAPEALTLVRRLMREGVLVPA